MPVAARAQDLLVLTNGDRISGTLVSITGTTWTFRHAGGDLALAADQMAEFTAAGPIGVRLQDGSIAAGRVTATGGVMRFTAADGTSRTITPADLAAFRAAVPGRAPAALAAHVAGCARCQRRLLEVDAPRATRPAAGRKPRPLVTLLLLAALGALAVVVLGWMAGR